MTWMVRKSHCKKRVQIFIVFCIFAGIFFYHFPFLLILAFIFFVNTDIDLDRIFVKYEIYTCIKELLWDEEKYKTFKKWVYSVDMQIAKYKWKNKKDKKVEKIEKMDKINYTWETLIYSSDKSKPVKETNINEEKLQTKTKRKQNSDFSFNNWKSVWDDYESVVDKLWK